MSIEFFGTIKTFSLLCSVLFFSKANSHGAMSICKANSDFKRNKETTNLDER